MSKEFLKLVSDHNVDVADKVVYMCGDVDENLYIELVQNLELIRKANPDTNALDGVTIYLSTYGGDVYYGFAIYDYLKLVASNLKIVCIGPVMSAGTLILQAADERVMMPHSYLLVHFGLEINENQQTRHQHEQLTRQIKQVLVDRCSAKAQTVKKWFGKESYFDNKRALSVGLVDRVVKHD
jgi:ATP-dependent Clp protease protease subunit